MTKSNPNEIILMKYALTPFLKANLDCLSPSDFLAFVAFGSFGGLGSFGTFSFFTTGSFLTTVFALFTKLSNSSTSPKTSAKKFTFSIPNYVGRALIKYALHTQKIVADLIWLILVDGVSARIVLYNIVLY